MAMKSYKPTTSSLRFRTGLTFQELTAEKPLKRLTKGKSGTGGRGAGGRISSWQRGGGHKKKYRRVDFRRDKHGIPGTVSTLEYDPNRSAFIALITYQDGEKRYLLAPEGLKVGSTVLSGPDAPLEPGNHLPLERIPLGMNVHNVEMQPGRGGQLVRAVGKAGRNRWRGIRPHVRGVAMNPHDHPHGGGEGKTSGGRHPVTPWGVPTKGYKTRKKRKYSSKFIVKRRK
jgi:large subunit ribosomal protein L2